MLLSILLQLRPFNNPHMLQLKVTLNLMSYCIIFWQPHKPNLPFKHEHKCRNHQVRNCASAAPIPITNMFVKSIKCQTTAAWLLAPSGLKPAHLKHIGSSEITQESSALIIVKEVRINPLQYIQWQTNVMHDGTWWLFASSFQEFQFTRELGKVTTGICHFYLAMHSTYHGLLKVQHCRYLPSWICFTALKLAA